MKRGDLIGTIAVLCVAIGAFLYFNRDSSKSSAPTLAAALSNGSLQVQQRWELPAELNEVSAIAWKGNEKIACVQDNDGTIFFFDLGSGRVTDRLHFAGGGDYEGLAIAGNDYYVLRSDGTLFEIKPGSSKPAVNTYPGPFSTRNDCESLSYDAKNNRLLVGVKEKDLSDPQRKGVYAFDLATKQFDTKPVYYIGSGSEAGHTRGKKKKDGIRPSDHVLAPGGTGLYVLDGPRAQLLLTDAGGTVERSIQLDKAVFPQPEGLCFSPSGELYLSSEAGKKSRATLARVQVK
ncbi:MAG: hypothetical protein EOO15_03735 [Chitinophagaceae bacterium]|nr:MAG: hypothetical protein EOO15_03735 [Chitinophagaceae bacterium]